MSTDQSWRSEESPTIWPPPPTIPADDGRSRLIALMTKYQSPTPLAKLMIGSLILTAVLCIASLVDQVVHGSRSQLLSSHLDKFASFCFMFCVMWWMLWTRVLYKNLGALGVTNLYANPEDVMIYFLVPVWNLFMPNLIYSEIWRASTPQETIDQSDGEWRRTPTTQIIPSWSIAVSLCVILIGCLHTSASDGVADSALDLAVRVIIIAFLVLSGALAKQLTARQEHRHAEIAASLWG